MQFGVKMEDTLVKIPKPVEGDVNLTDELMRCFPDERISFHENVLWCKEHLQVAHLSEMVTPDGRKIITKMWNGERSHHFRSRWSWSRSERPSQEALMDWRKHIDGAFLLTGITGTTSQPLRKEVMQSVSWTNHCSQSVSLPIILKL